MISQKHTGYLVCKVSGDLNMRSFSRTESCFYSSKHSRFRFQFDVAYWESTRMPVLLILAPIPLFTTAKVPK